MFDEVESQFIFDKIRNKWLKVAFYIDECEFRIKSKNNYG
jgi:hypothetical protein